MSGRAARQKGDRFERAIVELHKDIGVQAARVPLSGAAGGRFSGDVDVYARGLEAAPFVGEAKARGNGNGFVMLERWLGENDLLFLKRDRQEPMVVLPWRTWAELVKRSGAA